MKNRTRNEDELQKLMQHPDSQPVVMINLLKFKATTGAGESGEEAYNRYMQSAAPLLAKVEGRLLWQGQADQLIIGGPDDRWDRVLLVEYPSRAAFLQLLNMPEFQSAQRERLEALESTVLIAATTERKGFE